MDWEEPVEEKKSGGAGSLGAIIFVILTILVGLCYVAIYLNPQIALNPFKPPEVVIPTATIASGVVGITKTPPTFTPPPPYPATWTPTATPTSTPTNTPRPTATPTYTPGPVPMFSLYWDPIYTNQRLYGDQNPGDWWTGVAGEITDKQGKPVPDEIIKVWDDRGHVWETRTGNASEYGETYGSSMGGQGTFAWWEQFLYDSCQNSFDLHVQVIRNGKGVSPRVDVKTTGDCTKNLILIHFRKNY